MKSQTRNTKDHLAGLFVWPGLMGPQITPEEERVLRRYQPSGVVLFRRNMPSLSKAKALIYALRSLLPGCKVAIDEEGGRVSRIPFPFPRGLPAEQMASQGSLGLELAREQFLHQALVAKGLGIDVLLSPVADIQTQVNNPGLEERCYGKSAAQVSPFVTLGVEILKSQGIESCVKHFPGHGNTLADPHLDFASSDAGLKTLRCREWIPFQKAIEAGVNFIMTGHIVIPEIDPGKPATLSRKLLQDHLRKELGFQGIVLSDDLRMKAIAKHFGVHDSLLSAAIFGDVSGLSGMLKTGFLGRAAVEALDAGCDILLSCQSVLLEEEILEHISQQMETNPTFFALLESRRARFEAIGVH